MDKSCGGGGAADGGRGGVAARLLLACLLLSLSARQSGNGKWDAASAGGPFSDLQSHKFVISDSGGGGGSSTPTSRGYHNRCRAGNSFSLHFSFAEDYAVAAENVLTTKDD